MYQNINLEIKIKMIIYAYGQGKKGNFKLNIRGALCKTMDSQLLVKEFQHDLVLKSFIILA